MTEATILQFPLELREEFEALEIPCDFDEQHHCEAPAEWVLYRKPHGCGWLPPALACAGCKDSRLNGDWALECYRCDYKTAPAREFYSFVEHL